MEFNVRPAGKVPALTAHNNVGVPPLAATVCEYAAPTAPFGSEVVVIAGGGFTGRVNSCEEVLKSSSKTVRVNVEVADVMGTTSP
jgi:hypothetical protein